jgi:hypothetical protein
MVRSGVTFETRRIAAYSFWSYLHNSQGEEEAKRTLCIVFEQKYPNRDLNLALSEFDALLQTTIAPEIHAVAEAARRANRPP